MIHQTMDIITGIMIQVTDMVTHITIMMRIMDMVTHITIMMQIMDMVTHITIMIQGMDMVTHITITIMSLLCLVVNLVEMLELPPRGLPSTTSQLARTLTCPCQLSLVEVEEAPRINMEPQQRVMSTNTLLTPRQALNITVITL